MLIRDMVYIYIEYASPQINMLNNNSVNFKGEMDDQIIKSYFYIIFYFIWCI
ncbi:MAG: hypothetical protein K0R94_1416 [Burkholderiales bacterium]|jgi:hypothetical protein|nr:hypothetical protein [Burkholderiales bacterium]